MVKGQKTRKTRQSKKTRGKASILTIPQLRAAFDHMDKVVESVRKVSKHSFSDAVVIYREEWRKVFKRDLSPADASAYLKFRFGIKSGMTRRSKTRGGASPLSGASLDYSLRPGVSGTYGKFPTYQTEGLDRQYHSGISEDCGKPNSFPTDGSMAQQGGAFEGIRPLGADVPPGMLYKGQMSLMGAAPYPSADAVGPASTVSNPANYITTANLSSHVRSYGSDVYSMI